MLFISLFDWHRRSVNEKQVLLWNSIESYHPYSSSKDPCFVFLDYANKTFCAYYLFRSTGNVKYAERKGPENSPSHGQLVVESCDPVKFFPPFLTLPNFLHPVLSAYHAKSLEVVVFAPCNCQILEHWSKYLILYFKVLFCDISSLHVSFYTYDISAFTLFLYSTASLHSFLNRRYSLFHLLSSIYLSFISIFLGIFVSNNWKVCTFYEYFRA